MLSDVFRRILGGITPIFRPLERRLIEHLVTLLPSEAAALFAQQVGAINLVQRLSKGTEVNCYPMKGGRPCHDPNHRFPCTDSEFRLAAISFYDPRTNSRNRAEFHASGGYFFSIWFDRSPAGVKHADEVVIETARLLGDSMRARRPPVLEELATGEAQLPAWVTDLIAERPHEPPRVFAPLSPEERAPFLQRIRCRLPADYLELVEGCEGFSCGGWAIMGLSEMYEIKLPGGRYYVIGEREGCGVVVIRTGDMTGQLLYAPFDVEALQAYGARLSEAIHQISLVTGDAV
jgi:hypothetical protein